MWRCGLVSMRKGLLVGREAMGLTVVLPRRHLNRILPFLHPKIRTFSPPPHPSPPPDVSLQSQATSSSFRQQVSLASVLQRYGFPQSQLHDFLSKYQFLHDTTQSQLEECIGLLLSFGLPQKSLVSILSSSPGVLELQFLRTWKIGFAQMGFSTVPTVIIQRALEQSGRFGLEPDGLQCILQELRELGFCNETLIRVFEELPGAPMVFRSLDVAGRIEFMESFGFQRDEVDQICRSFPRFLAFSIGDKLRPLFEEFGDLGFSEMEVKREVVENPRLLLGMEVGELSRCMELLKSLKCRLPIKERILDKGPLNAAVQLKLRVDCLCSHGLIRREALKVIWKEPRSILYELEDIKKKINFLLHEMGFSIDCLVEVPEYLGVNLEKQIVPRHQVIECLRSRGWLGFVVSLRDLVKPSRKKFYNMFVKPYPECEKIFGRLLRDAEVRTRYPSGLWKLFKPLKHPKSEDDGTT